MPTLDWPTVTISSVKMHRTAYVSPKRDTESKIKALGKLRGLILDTCFGLG